MTNPTPTPETMEVEGNIFALIPQYHQATVVTDDGNEYSIARHTRGVRLNDLRVGQRVRCTVKVRLPRVLTARVLE